MREVLVHINLQLDDDDDSTIINIEEDFQILVDDYSPFNGTVTLVEEV